LQFISPIETWEGIEPSHRCFADTCVSTSPPGLIKASDLYFTMISRKLQVKLGDELNSELPFSLRGAAATLDVAENVITSSL
jgi:hypothetical protein